MAARRRHQLASLANCGECRSSCQGRTTNEIVEPSGDEDEAVGSDCRMGKVRSANKQLDIRKVTQPVVALEQLSIRSSLRVLDHS